MKSGSSVPSLPYYRVIYSPLCAAIVAGIDKIFRLHDVTNSGMVVGDAESAILVSNFEYADDAALVDDNAALYSLDSRHGTRYWLHCERCKGDLHQNE